MLSELTSRTAVGLDDEFDFHTKELLRWMIVGAFRMKHTDCDVT